VKKRLLISNQYFYPGYKAGGPIRSLLNLINLLDSSYEIYIYTTNSDLDGEAYQNITPDQWVEYPLNTSKNQVKVFYSAMPLSLHGLLKLIKEINPTHIYANSFFDWHFSIKFQILNFLKLMPIPLIIAPRGELQPESLMISKIKKMVYMNLFTKFIINRNLVFQATNTNELQTFSHLVSKSFMIKKADDTPLQPLKMLQTTIPSETLKLCFVGRVSPIKNLDYAINILSKIPDINIQFRILGAIDDKAYWNQCLQQLKQLPSNIQWLEPVSGNSEWLLQQLANCDLLFFPTKSESFGHVIAESLTVGTPVLISDQTPWQDLEQLGIGWSLPLDDPNQFINSIRSFHQTETKLKLEQRRKAFTYMQQRFNKVELAKQYDELFQ